MQITFETPDQPDVHELIGELDAYLYSLYPPENVYALDISALLHPSVLFAVVRDAAGASVGCGAIVMKPGYGEVKRMYVRPRVRGRGLARRLIEALEAKAVEQGCRTFMLETGPTQPEALILYERLGYQWRGPFGDYPDDPLSVFMQKSASKGLTTGRKSRNAQPLWVVSCRSLNGSIRPTADGHDDVRSRIALPI